MAEQRISAPVGQSSINKAQDVVTVQRLLNGHLERDPCRKLLKVDGRYSEEFVQAIRTFQTVAGSPATVSGRVEPSSPTLWLLNQPPGRFGYENKLHVATAKPVTESTIEVFVFDAILKSAGSQWGHAAIDIDGIVYSRAHTKYAVLQREEYIPSNLKTRDVVGLVLRVSKAEKEKIRAELDRRVALNEPYSITANSCSTNVADVLESVGILAHDPRFQLAPSSTNSVSPKELLIVLSRSSRVIKRNNYKRVGS
jgi:peptidoglycan hydrolase-like protein with peptidoglycan-binding domain